MNPKMNPIKALTLRQPEASLAAFGEKPWETRGRAMHHRGALAIHAAKKTPPDWLARRHQEPFLSALRQPEGVYDREEQGPPFSYGPDDPLPQGCVLAMVWVRDCVPVEKIGRFEQLGDADPKSKAFWVSEKAWAFGDFTPGIGRTAIALDYPRLLPYTVPARGSQALGWDWTPEDTDIAEWVELWTDWHLAMERVVQRKESRTAAKGLEQAFLALDRKLRERGKPA